MKVIEITNTNAAIKMVRMDVGSVFMALIAVIILILVKIDDPGEMISCLAITASAVLALTGLVVITISASCKSEIKALNILYWPMWKYILKEGKDE